MKYVFVIEFEAYHCYLHSDRESEKDTKTFGAFDTALRGVSYLRRFLYDESQNCTYDYYDKTLKTTEKDGEIVYAEAYRRYKGNDILITETLTMKRYELNGLEPPEDEIISIYCG